MKDFMNNLHPTIKFTFEHSTQEVSFLDMKIHKGADRKLLTTLYTVQKTHRLCRTSTLPLQPLT